MLLDDVPRDREPEPRAAATDPDLVDLVEALENARSLGGRNADAVILDGQDDVIAGGPDGDPDLARDRLDCGALGGPRGVVDGVPAMAGFAVRRGSAGRLHDRP